MGNQSSKHEVIDHLCMKIERDSSLPLAATVNNEDNKWVIYRGNPNSPIMVIGEAPGKDEALQGKPFVGKSGELFNKQMKKALDISEFKDAIEKITGSSDGATKENIKQLYFVTNCMFVRPPGNRDPMANELLKYAVYLKQIILSIRPKLIICLGRYAATLIKNGCNVHRMYLRPEQYPLTEMEPPTKRMISVRKEEGNLMNVIIDDIFPCRSLVMTHPAWFLHSERRLSKQTYNDLLNIWQAKLRKAFFMLQHMETEIPIRGSWNICGPPLNRPFPETEEQQKEYWLITKPFMPFPDKDKLFDEFEKIGLGQVELRNSTTPICLAKSPLLMEFRCVEYHPCYNVLSIYGTTPDGFPANIKLHGVDFPFYFTKHESLVDKSIWEEKNDISSIQ